MSQIHRWGQRSGAGQQRLQWFSFSEDQRYLNGSMRHTDNLYYPLDTDHVRDGQWQEGVSEALAEYGYAYFNQIHHTVQKTQRLELEQHSGEEDNLQPSPHSFRPLPQCCEVKETHQNELGALQEGTSRKKIHGINRDGNLTADEEEHAHGLGVELLLATSEVKRSFSRGDRVVCQWRQPTRLDHPRIDLAAWHPARVTEVHKDHHYVDVVFESGACERLSRVHVKHLHLAPHPNSIKPIPHEGEDIPTVALSSKSCRELAHIAKKNEAVQRTWNQIMPITEELKRLRGLCIKHSRRPEWQGTFPAVSCNMTRRLTTKRKKRIKLRNTQTKEQLQSPLPQERNVCDLQENTLNQSIHLGRQRTTPIATIVESSSGRGGNISSTVHSAQMVLIASVMAYEKCVSAVHDCIERGRTAYHEAHTYSEQHKAFEEVTANLGFYQPARAGYNDWRGQPVIGLQNATVDAIEAVGKWVEARCADAQGGGGGSHGTMRFFWKGQHFLLCIIDQTEHIFSRAPELGEWYGPGFPIHRNPFCLSYNLDERPCTPRNIMVRSFVNGEYTTTISPTLLMEREREETALKAITDRQEEAPSWWPARGMDKQHFQRIRSAERILLLEEQSINAKGQEPTLCMTVPR
ncbi:unnamed protein product [Choristocarpus tenellus]